VLAYLSQDGTNAAPGLHSNWIGFGPSVGLTASEQRPGGAGASDLGAPTGPGGAGGADRPVRRRRPWSVLAMARPSERSLRDFGLVAWMRGQDPPVTAVFNLQQPGEHPWCGDGIVPPAGFSYRPETLGRGGLAYYPLGWADFGVPTLEAMSVVVKLMAKHEDEGGRVSVHCHAGLGRTGLVIACFLVYRYRLSAEEAVEEVRADRPGSVQTWKQAEFVGDFAARVTACRRAFLLPRPVGRAAGAGGGRAAPGIRGVLEAQAFLLRGREAAELRHAPAVLQRAARGVTVILRCALLMREPAAGRGRSPRAAARAQQQEAPRDGLAAAAAAACFAGRSPRAELDALVAGVNDGHWSLLEVDDAWCSGADASQRARLVARAGLWTALLALWCSSLPHPLVLPEDMGGPRRGAGGAPAVAVPRAPGWLRERFSDRDDGALRADAVRCVLPVVRAVKEAAGGAGPAAGVRYLASALTQSPPDDEHARWLLLAATSAEGPAWEAAALAEAAAAARTGRVAQSRGDATLEAFGLRLGPRSGASPSEPGWSPEAAADAWRVVCSVIER